MWKRHRRERKYISYLSAGSLDLSLRNVYSYRTVKHQNNSTTGTMERQLEFRRILDRSVCYSPFARYGRVCTIFGAKSESQRDRPVLFAYGW
jgi:hypothetical protein